MESAVAADRPEGYAAERAFQLAAEAGADLPKLALEFAAQQPGVASTLVGCAHAEEVLANAQAFESAPTLAEARVIGDIRGTFDDA